MDEVKWKIGATKISLRNLVEGTITAGVVLMLALWISAVLERRLLANATGQDLSWRKIVATLLRTVLLFVGLMFALSAVGIDLTALSVLGGGLAVGLGFGLQKIAANYVSGFVILAERSIRIGDMVKVDNFEGQISDIRTRYTVIRSLNGREAIIPNETLITTRVENSSLADRRVLMQTTVPVAYDTDVRKLQPRLQAAAAAVSRVVDEPAPSVQVAAFAGQSIELVVNFWITDPEGGQGNVRSEVNLAVLDVLRAEGVVFPSAQQTVLVSRAPTAEPPESAPPSGAATQEASGDTSS
jgi:small-conductance mechanosensitive channel